MFSKEVKEAWEERREAQGRLVDNSLHSRLYGKYSSHCTSPTDKTHEMVKQNDRYALPRKADGRLFGLARRRPAADNERFFECSQSRGRRCDFVFHAEAKRMKSRISALETVHIRD